MQRLHGTCTFLLAAATLVGCIGLVDGGNDAGAIDASVALDAGDDAGSIDAGSTDAAVLDAGSIDAGAADAGRPRRDAGFVLVEGLSDASVLGTFDGGTWTPGRDDAGVVTALSWSQVPLREGVRVAGTRLDQLDSVVHAALPAWNDFGVSRWNGVLNNWNGFALDLKGARAWLVAAGGHSGSSNNGIYRFDLYRMAWAVEELPSDSSVWSTAYQQKANGSTFTPCDESNAAFLSARDAGTLKPIDDWYWDELYWDRTPTSRHTYSSAVYVPGREELVLAVRRFWRYSLSTHAWVYKRLINDSPDQVMAGSGTYAFYDEHTDEVLMGGAGDALYAGFALPLDGGAWSNWSTIAYADGIADVRSGRKIIGFSVPARPDFAYASPGRYYVYSLDSRSNQTTGEIQYGPGLSRDDFPSGYAFYDGTALCEVPPLGRYWVATQVNGTMQFLELDPSTTPWTLRRLALDGLAPAWDDNVMRKFVYWPTLKAITLTTRGDADVWLYRLE